MFYMIAWWHQALESTEMFGFCHLENDFRLKSLMRTSNGPNKNVSPKCQPKLDRPTDASAKLA